MHRLIHTISSDVILLLAASFISFALIPTLWHSSFHLNGVVYFFCQLLQSISIKYLFHVPHSLSTIFFFARFHKWSALLAETFDIVYMNHQMQIYTEIIKKPFAFGFTNENVNNFPKIYRSSISFLTHTKRWVETVIFCNMNGMLGVRLERSEFSLIDESKCQPQIPTVTQIWTNAPCILFFHLPQTTETNSYFWLMIFFLHSNKITAINNVHTQKRAFRINLECYADKPDVP